MYEYGEFKEDGQEKNLRNGEYPNVSGDFIEVETKLIQKGYEPSIYDFSIELNGNNLTNEILSEEKLLIYISYNIENFSSYAVENLKLSAQKAKNKGYKIMV